MFVANKFSTTACKQILIMELALALITLHTINISHAQTCLTANACNGVSISKTDADVHFSGYKSGYNSTVTTTGLFYTSCDGSHSCIESKLSLSSLATIELQGAFAATDSVMIAEWGIRCDAVFTAAGSQMTIGNDLRCNAHSSCRESNISLAGAAYAAGAFALCNSSIQSTGSMAIQFTGYKSGCNAKINCQDDDVCAVECFGVGACENLECFGSGCTVTYFNSSTATVQGVIEYDAFELLTSKEAQCNEQGSAAYDDYRENFGGAALSPQTASTICCRGGQSCYILTSISDANNVFCGSHQSCASVQKIVANEVLCGGVCSCE